MLRAILITCTVLILASSPSASGDTLGRPAPVCELAPLGNLQRIDMQQLRGKVLYVDFWASWCGPCAKAFPFLNAMNEKYADRGLHILGINVDEKAEDAKQFLSKHPASFMLAADPSGRCPADFGVQAMPSSYLVDRDGIVRYVHLGFRTGDAEKIRREIERMLSAGTDGR